MQNFIKDYLGRISDSQSGIQRSSFDFTYLLMVKYVKLFMLLISVFMTSSFISCKPESVGESLHKSLGTDYYIHPTAGDDTNNGTSPDRAIRTLEKASQLDLKPGDRLLLAAGERHVGSLRLVNINGEVDRMVTVTSFAFVEGKEGQLAHIDAKGEGQGVLIQNGKYIEVNSLYITANGHKPEIADKPDMQCGVLVNATNGDTENIVLSKLRIEDIFFENPGYKNKPEDASTSNGGRGFGFGIRLINVAATRNMKNIRIADCQISNIEHMGIRLTGSSKVQTISDVVIVGNRLHRTGGPGIQMSSVKDIHVFKNEVTYSGSVDDSRKWGRGSGVWTWNASNVLIEKNSFSHANGPNDSFGAHIDYDCDNVIIQYNFSADNAGGFCQILGNNRNCAYRYNVSVNDGHRLGRYVGKTISLTGYRGKSERITSVNTYIYNNTIYVKPEIVANFKIENGTNGLLIANNIFHIVGKSSMVEEHILTKRPDRLFFSNNLFLRTDNWPSKFPMKDVNPVIGDADFAKDGGLNIEDYIPGNKALVRAKGVRIPRLEGDSQGLMKEIDTDITGKPIGNVPSIGAIEVN